MAKNSATSRLLLLLEFIASESNKQKRETTLSVVLMSYVGVPPEEGWQDDVRPLLLFSRVIELCAEAIEEVETFFDDRDLPDDQRAAVRERASQPLRSVLHLFATKSVTRPAVEFVPPELGEIVPLALATQQRVGAETLRDEQRKEIRDAIAKLREALLSSDLAPELRGRFLRVLRDLERALDEQKAFGVTALLSAVGALVGLATVTRSQVNADQQPAVWQQISHLVNVVGAIDITYRVASFALEGAVVLKALGH